jgi:hypothetical protein
MPFVKCGNGCWQRNGEGGLLNFFLLFVLETKSNKKFKAKRSLPALEKLLKSKAKQGKPLCRISCRFSIHPPPPPRFAWPAHSSILTLVIINKEFNLSILKIL